MGAFSVILKTDESFAALHKILYPPMFIFCIAILYCPGKASANGSVPCKTKSASVEAEPVKEQEGGKGKQTARRSGHQVDDGQGLIIARDFLQLSTQVTI